MIQSQINTRYETASTTEMTLLLRLPNELQVDVWSFLTLRECVVGRTASREWRKSVEFQPKLFVLKRPNHNVSNTDTSPKIQPLSTSIIIDSETFRGVVDIDKQVDLCNVRELYIQNVSWIVPNKQYPNIVKLYLQNIFGTIDIRPYFSPTHFGIQDVNDFLNRFDPDSFRMFPCLEHVEIHGNYIQTSATFFIPPFTHPCVKTVVVRFIRCSPSLDKFLKLAFPNANITCRKFTSDELLNLGFKLITQQ